MKRNTYWSSIVHAFAVKELEDGRILFADARGYTDSALQFFADFRFSKQTMEVLPWDGQKFYDSDLDVLRKNVEPFYNLIFAADVSKGQALPSLDSKIQSASIRAAEPTQYSHTELLHVPPKDKSRCFFHVTPMENVQNIMEHGLVPKIGERSGAQGEETPAIYLFPTMDDMDNALSNWLGEWFEDIYGPDVELAIVKAFLPPDIYVHYDLSVAYECYVTEPIPSQHLFFFTESGEPLRKSLDRVISDTSRRVSVADLSSANQRTAEILK